MPPLRVGGDDLHRNDRPRPRKPLRATGDCSKTASAAPWRLNCTLNGSATTSSRASA
ncbi:MAG: hypothetical protein EPO40_31215 [Myxococcaceae bacterium]|nr:MAG: hypothetical protein EPO40_31215 [Myxococcaceae bacterium]